MIAILKLYEKDAMRTKGFGRGENVENARFIPGWQHKILLLLACRQRMTQIAVGDGTDRSAGFFYRGRPPIGGICKIPWQESKSFQ